MRANPTQSADTAALRAKFLPPETDSWESLDDPHWVITKPGAPGNDQEKEEGTEAFFRVLYRRMRGDRA